MRMHPFKDFLKLDLCLKFKSELKRFCTNTKCHIASLILKSETKINHVNDKT